MRHSRRYAAALVLPPLAVAFPIALAFLIHVTRGKAWLPVTIAASLAYGIGALIAAAVLARAAAEVERDVETQRDPSRSISSALATTTLTSLIFWTGWGAIVAMAGCALVEPTFLGIQYFFEAALIVAAPAMAWSYWTGKSRLLRIAARAPHVAYSGQVWGITSKIAMVFIGFFIVSVGALVLVISSRVSQRLGEQMAYEIARFGLAVAVGTTIVFGVATWFLARDITAPMKALVELAHEMAQGRFDAEPRIFSDDEVGKLAGSFGVTRRNLRTLLAQVSRQGGSIAEGVRMMSAGTESLVSGAHEQSGIAEQSNVALRLVQTEAQSVLDDAESVTDRAMEAAESATELRASSAEVAKQMDHLGQSVEKSSSAAQEIDASIREMARRTNEVSSIGSEILAFVTQMDATVDQITRTAHDTADVSQQVKENAVVGRAAVDATVEGIRNVQASTQRTAGAFESLQKSLGQIDQILVFIDEVTNRTNLLSLNAAIIAAQAGRNDYGFSVIADEVRQLADRTRTATKEIATIIRGVQPVAQEAVDALAAGADEVDRTVHLANEATASLGTILTSADRTLDMTRAMSKSLQEQSTASHHLQRVMSKMSENVQEIHRATEGQAIATQMLAVEAERVSDIAEEVRRAAGEQVVATNTIAKAMEQIAHDVRSTRDRLGRQLHQAEQAASASRITLTIAEKNNSIAEEFSRALQALLATGQKFESEVARFRG